MRTSTSSHRTATAAAFARSPFSPAAGNRADGQTAALVQYAPAAHGGNWGSEHGWLRYDPTPDLTGDVRFHKLPNPIRIPNPIYETLDQVLEILETHQAGRPPRVRMTKPPVLDFDGDGTPDATAPAPMDPSSYSSIGTSAGGVNNPRRNSASSTASVSIGSGNQPPVRASAGVPRTPAP